MLSVGLLALLREWWRVSRREGVLHVDDWLFLGQHYLKPLSTPQIYRVAVEAGQVTGIGKRVRPHTLRGHAELETTAYYTQVATRVRRNVSGFVHWVGERSPTPI